MAKRLVHGAAVWSVIILAACASAVERATSVPSETAEIIADADEENARRTEDRIPNDYFDTNHGDDGGLLRLVSPNVVPIGPQWRKPVVTVAFNGGSPAIRALIEQTAGEWTAQSGGHFAFSFRASPRTFRQWSEADRVQQADIRIAFNPNDASWSKIGVQAARVQPNKPTMNFSFAASLERLSGRENATRWQNSYYHRSVLHEFGHALGLEHEQFHAACQSDLNIEAAIANLMRTEGWREDAARFAVDADDALDQWRKTGVQVWQSPVIDQASVMMYPLPPSVMNSRLGSPCMSTGPGRFADGSRYATSLSTLDIRYMRVAYGHAFTHRPAN